MKGLVVRHRRSGYARTIIPFDEDHEYWYVTEIQGKKEQDSETFILTQ